MYWWWCETRQCRLLLIGSARVSFIHSFIRFISHLGSGKSTTGIHLFFLSRFYFILSAQYVKKKKKNDDEWGKNNSSSSFNTTGERRKKEEERVDNDDDDDDCWSSKLNSVFFPDVLSNGQDYSLIEQWKRDRFSTYTHLSPDIFFSSSPKWMDSIYIWSCMRTFPRYR